MMSSAEGDFSKITESVSRGFLSGALLGFLGACIPYLWPITAPAGFAYGLVTGATGRK